MFFPSMRFGLPEIASATPSPEVFPWIQCDDSNAWLGTMDLVGTCNVLTLHTATRARDPATSVGASGPTRQQIIFRQFAEAGVCMFALQETRLQRINSLIHDYNGLHWSCYFSRTMWHLDSYQHKDQILGDWRTCTPLWTIIA